MVSGDITRGELRALAEARFGGWPRAEPPRRPRRARPARRGARLVLVDKPGAPQTALRVAAIGAARNTPDYPALQVMNAALGGLFSSRININLREDKGYTYGVFSQFRYDRTPGPFVDRGQRAHRRHRRVGGARSSRKCARMRDAAAARGANWPARATRRCCRCRASSRPTATSAPAWPRPSCSTCRSTTTARLPAQLRGA